MITEVRQIRLSEALVQAMALIDLASAGKSDITAEEITALYNATCDTQLIVSADEYSLARTLAIGAITEQVGSNIQASAAIANLMDLLDQTELQLAEGGEAR